MVRSEFSTEVPSPPHDALTPAERRAHIAAHPLSYLGVTRGPEDAAPGVGETPDELLIAGREALTRLLEANVFTDLRDEAMYAYRLENAEHRQTGVLCGIFARSRAQGQLRAHEEVRGARRDHLARHLETVEHQSSPVVVSHRHDPVIAAELEMVANHDPMLSIKSADGLTQTIWELSGESIERIVHAAAEMPLYIIDGHHRTGAAEVNSETGGANAQWVLGAMFPEDEMRNHAHHRWLQADDPATAISLIEKTLPTHRVSIHEIERRTHGQIGVYADHRWLLVELPGGSGETAFDVLEPVRLNDVLADLGLDELPMNFLAGTRPLPDLARTIDSSGGVLFAMNPIEMDELFAVADAGLIMPAKSTYFSPKARSGVVLRPVGVTD
ncbi:MAG: DUF1015 domain-containing protein [Actinomycetia bacterium]|nr:DUF1015 domain-containing protein [Actinomycetes bacterium]